MATQEKQYISPDVSHEVYDAQVMQDVLYKMHKYATEQMGELEAKGGPISSLPLQARQFLAHRFVQIVGEHMADSCTIVRPDESRGSDLCIAIMNLYQLANLAIQYDEDNETSRAFDAIHSLRDAGLNVKHCMGITSDIELYSREHNLTLRDVVAIIGPVMFASYKRLAAHDYMVTYYEETRAERIAKGYTAENGYDPVRRIQYICVVLNNEGPMKSDVFKQCLAITAPPDLRIMNHVKAYTMEMDSSLYHHIENDYDDTQAAWIHQQKMLRTAEAKVLKEKEAEGKLANVTTAELQKPVAHCMVCFKKSTTKCGRCKCVFYCSRECQVSNWSAHKADCKPTEES